MLSSMTHSPIPACRPCHLDMDTGFASALMPLSSALSRPAAGSRGALASRANHRHQCQRAHATALACPGTAEFPTPWATSATSAPRLDSGGDVGGFLKIVSAKARSNGISSQTGRVNCGYLSDNLGSQTSKSRRRESLRLRANGKHMGSEFLVAKYSPLNLGAVG